VQFRAFRANQQLKKNDQSNMYGICA